MTESATRFRPRVGTSIEASGALEVVTTVERNANGGGFGRAVACCECTRRGIGAQSGQGRAYGTSGTRRRITAVSLSFRHCRVRRGAPGVVGGRPVGRTRTKAPTGPGVPASPCRRRGEPQEVVRHGLGRTAHGPHPSPHVPRPNPDH